MALARTFLAQVALRVALLYPMWWTLVIREPVGITRVVAV